MVVGVGCKPFATSRPRGKASSSSVVRRGRSYKVPEGTVPLSVDEVERAGVVGKEAEATGGKGLASPARSIVAEATLPRSTAINLHGCGSEKNGERPEGREHIWRYTMSRCTTWWRRS